MIPDLAQTAKINMNSDWLPLQAHYERCLRQHGASPSGVDWPNAADLEARFATQLTVLSGIAKANELPLVLDIGCGPGLFLDWLAATGQADKIRYHGVDISPVMVEMARVRWPNHFFEVRDIVSSPLPAGSVDVAIMNGVLTERQNILREDMIAMAERLVLAAFRVSRHGVAFNTMSKHVDWERDDLFHWGFDEVASFLTKQISRHVAFRADYGLYEFTAFVWHGAQRPEPLGTTWWLR